MCVHVCVSMGPQNFIKQSRTLARNIQLAGKAGNYEPHTKKTTVQCKTLIKQNEIICSCSCPLAHWKGTTTINGT